MWEEDGDIYDREKDKKEELWWGHNEKKKKKKVTGLGWVLKAHHIGIHTQRHHQIGAGLKLMQ